MGLSFPAELRYADSHEYAGPSDDGLKVGISAFAVDQLGDIVFIELPEVGASIEKGSSFGTVESVKAVEEMYAPVSGTVVAANQAVIDSPELLQNDPYEQGWLLKITPADPSQLEQLMDATSYSAKVEGGS